MIASSACNFAFDTEEMISVHKIRKDDSQEKKHDASLLYCFFFLSRAPFLQELQNDSKPRQLHN